MPELNSEHVKAVIRAINDCPFFKHMSMEVAEIGIGYSVVVAEILRNHMNPFGGLQGGVYASLIDTAAYWSVYCDLQEENGLVSIDLNVDFLAPALDGKVIARGQRIKSGRTICLGEASMFDGNGRILAHGTSKLMVTRNRQCVNDIADYVGCGILPKKFLRN